MAIELSPASACPPAPQMQLYFNIPSTWNKRVQLRLSGEPSFTLRPKPNDFTYGKVRRAGVPLFPSTAWSQGCG